MKTEFKSDWGAEVVAGGGGEVVAEGDMPEDMSNKSLEAAGGEAGLFETDGFAAVTNEKSRPFDEVDWVRCCGLGGDFEGACVSKNAPPVTGGGEET